MTERPDAAPASGFVDGVFVFPVRVYYEDTDAAGMVYYANYLKFAERARTEMLRALGWGQAALMADKRLAFVVRRCVADYVRPARLDDNLSLTTRLAALRGAALDVEQIVQRDTVDLVRLDVTVACVNFEMRAARIPPRLRAALQDLGRMNERKG